MDVIRGRGKTRSLARGLGSQEPVPAVSGLAEVSWVGDGGFAELKEGGGPP